MATKKPSPLLVAYQAAWLKRVATGAKSEDVLLEELRRHDVPHAENKDL